MTTEIERLRTSLVQVRIGNRVYDAHSVSTCHTCMHPARMEIEQKLVEGLTYRAIENLFSGVEVVGPDGSRQILPTVRAHSIRSHFHRGHMPIAAAAIRELTERRAQQLGHQYEDLAFKFADHVTMAQAIVQRGHERLISGEVEPELRDALAAAKFLKEVEDSALGSVDAEAWSQAMMIYFETAQSMMPSEMWERFTKELSSNTILRGLAQRMSGEETAPVMESLEDGRDRTE